MRSAGTVPWFRRQLDPALVAQRLAHFGGLGLEHADVEPLYLAVEQIAGFLRLEVDAQLGASGWENRAAATTRRACMRQRMR